MNFIKENIQAYSENHSTDQSALLKKIERDTYANVIYPRMLSGHIQGRMLSLFSHMLKPKNVLEIGTFTGYSALCMAEGLSHNGKIITIDINEELETRVNGYFEASAYKESIAMIVGNALQIIPTLDTKFDLIFIDADKTNYLNYFNLVIDKVNAGGFIIADNVLWSGKVAETLEHGDKDTAALMEFNEAVHADDRVENLLLPLRDGLMVMRKL